MTTRMHLWKVVSQFQWWISVRYWGVNQQLYHDAIQYIYFFYLDDDRCAYDDDKDWCFHFSSIHQCGSFNCSTTVRYHYSWSSSEYGRAEGKGPSMLMLWKVKLSGATGYSTSETFCFQMSYPSLDDTLVWSFNKTALINTSVGCLHHVVSQTMR